MPTTGRTILDTKRRTLEPSSNKNDTARGSETQRSDSYNADAGRHPRSDEIRPLQVEIFRFDDRGRVLDIGTRVVFRAFLENYSTEFYQTWRSSGTHHIPAVDRVSAETASWLSRYQRSSLRSAILWGRSLCLPHERVGFSSLDYWKGGTVHCTIN